MEPALKQLLLKDGLVLGPEIGKGSFGTVFRCTDVKTQISYAVKKVDLRVLRMQPHFVLDRLKRECSVLEKLGHPSVVRLFKTIEAEDAILMVMEMVLGMELFEMIIAVNGMGESESCAVYIQIASALAYMHKQGVVHRDIKPENILIQGSTGDPSELQENPIFKDAFHHLRPRVKLIDFGLSKSLGTGNNGGSVAKSLVGTPRYVAPEIIAIGERMRRRDRELTHSGFQPEQLSYTEKVDCYSAGVLLHVMLSACFPQFGPDQEVIFTDKRIAKVSSGAKDLISKLMSPYPESRMSMADSLSHPWVRKHHPRAAQAALHLAGYQPVAPPMSGQALKFPSFEMNFRHDFLDPSHRPTELESDGSRESMIVDAFLGHHGEGEEGLQTTPTRGGKSPMSRGYNDDLGEERIAGVKRQITKEYSRPRNLSMSSQQSSSKSSMEVINLPGAAKGVWGPFKPMADTSCGDDAGSRQNSTESDETHDYNTMFTRKRNDTEEDDAALVPRMYVQPSSDEKALLNVRPSDDLVNPEQLLQLQANIAQCFRQSFEAFKNDDVVSPGIVSSAVASRELLAESETILKKLEQTSLSVLDLLPDMKIAVEEGEFGMAVTCFDTIKEWIKLIKIESQDLLKANVRVIAAVNNTFQLARRRHRVRMATKSGFRVTDALALEGQLSKPSKEENGSGTRGGAVEAAEAGQLESANLLKRKELEEVLEERRQGSADCTTPEEAVAALKQQRKAAEERRESLNMKLEQQRSPSGPPDEMAMIPRDGNEYVVIDGEYELEPISKALTMLQQIDRLLQKHASFWTNMEVLVNFLMQRANHVETMVNYTTNARVRGRFIERVDEYCKMWTQITQMCQRFHNESSHLKSVKLYQFLTEA